MSFIELCKQYVALNQAINVGALHETAADNTLFAMLDAYREENKDEMQEDGEPWDDDIVMDAMLNDMPTAQELSINLYQ